MAVTSVKEIGPDRSAEFGDDYSRKYTRTFRVRTDSDDTGPTAVAFAPGIPRPWSRYVGFNGTETDVLAVCRRVTPKPAEDEHRVWVVTCEYETVSGEQATGGGDGADNKPGGGGAADRPDLRPPKIAWRGESVSKPLRKAWDNEGIPVCTRSIPVLNTAAQPFDPLPEYEDGYLVLEVQRIEPSFDPLKARRYLYALNNEQFLFAYPTQAQVVQYDGTLTFFGNVPWWEVSYKVRFCPGAGETDPNGTRRPSWQPDVLDAGRYQLGVGAFAVPRLEPIRDSLTQQPVTEDVPLNGAGVPLTPVQIAATGVFYRRFAAYLRLPFSALNLPV